MRKSQSYSLTEGFLLPAIVRFSIPLMLSNVLQVLFNMSDIAVVGRFADSQALGAVGSTTILVSLFTGFLIGMGSGVNVVTALYLGARQHQDVIQTVHTSAILLLITGVLLLVFGFLFTPPMLRLLGTKDELLDGAIRYLRIYLLGMPALAVFNFGNGVLSASGDTKRPLLFLSIAGALSVALNLLFVIVFQMAEAGVALASAVSQYVSASLIVLSLAHRTESMVPLGICSQMVLASSFFSNGTRSARTENNGSIAAVRAGVGTDGFICLSSKYRRSLSISGAMSL